MLDKNGKKLLVSDIARAAGVSPTAVSRYLNSSGYVSQEKVQAIQLALEVLGAEAESGSPTLRGRNRRVFAFLAPPYAATSSMQFSVMGSVFSDAAKSRGYATKIYPVDLTRLTLIEALEQILSDRPCGILIPVVPMLSLDRQTQQFIQECGVPIVLFSEFPTPYSRIHSIINSFDAGISLSVEHLLHMGCRRLALLTPPGTQSKSAGLQQAAFLACTKADPLVEKARIFTHRWTDPQFAQAGFACAEQAFSQDPDLDGIIGWTDAYCAGILWYLYKTGRQVPRDVKLIAANDDYAPYLCPPLISIAFYVVRRLVDKSIDRQADRDRMKASAADIGKAVLFSLAVVGAPYVFAVFAERLTGWYGRIFQTYLAPITAGRVGQYAVYYVLFFVLFSVYAFLQADSVRLRGASERTNYWLTLLVNALPAVLFLGVLYGKLVLTHVTPINGREMSRAQGAMMGMLLLYFVVAKVVTGFYKKSGNIYVVSAVNAAFITWLSVNTPQLMV